MLERISIKGYKSFRELDFSLRPLNVLIGANGSGKSNFLSFFELLRYSFTSGLDVYVARKGGANSFLYLGAGATGKIEASLLLDGKGAEAQWVFVSGDKLRFEGDESLKKVAAKPYHFHETGDASGLKLTNNLYDNHEFHGDNLAAFLYMLRETKNSYYQLIVKTVRLVVPFFDDFVLEPHPHNPETILLRWKEKGFDTPLYATHFSDGTLRFIALATLLLQPTLPPLILIDEPELGLHPYAVASLAGMLKSAAVQTQVMVATQAANFVKHFAPEAVVVVDRIEGQTTFQRLSEHELEPWLEDYSLGDLWEMNVIGGKPQP